MIKTFNDLYAHELAMLVSAEARMVDMLPRLAAGTETSELQAALRAQEDSCRQQRSILEELLRESPQSSPQTPSRGMQSLLDECAELLETFPAGNLRDAVIIAHLQRAEHYKMAAYASLHDYAKLLGFKSAAERLAHTGKAVLGASRNLGAIAIQVDAEAYVDTRIEKT